MQVERTKSGFIVISDIINGQLITRKYIGYSVKTAKSLFKKSLTVFLLLVCFVSGFAGNDGPLHIYSERFNTSLNVARSSYQFEYKGLSDLKEYTFNTYLEVNELLPERDAEIIKGLNKNQIYREYRKQIVIIENSVFWKPE